MAGQAQRTSPAWQASAVTPPAAVSAASCMNDRRSITPLSVHAPDVGRLERASPRGDAKCRPVRGGRDDLDAVVEHERRVFDLGPCDRRIPGERLSRLDRFSRCGVRDPFARAVADRASLMVSELLVSETCRRVGVGGRGEQRRARRARARLVEQALEDGRGGARARTQIGWTAPAATIRETLTIRPSRSAHVATSTTCFQRVAVGTG